MEEEAKQNHGEQEIKEEYKEQSHDSYVTHPAQIISHEINISVPSEEESAQ